MNIRLHIDRLVIDGLAIDAHQAAAVREALTAELTRLLTEGGAPNGLLASGGAVPAIGTDAIHLPPGRGPNPAALGVQIAQAVHGGLGR